jgi:hypothetical protein
MVNFHVTMRSIFSKRVLSKGFTKAQAIRNPDFFYRLKVST